MSAAEIRAALDAIAPMPEDGEITAAQLARHFAVRAAQRNWRALNGSADEGLDPAQIGALCAEFAAAHALYALHGQAHAGPERDLGIDPAVAGGLRGCSPDHAAAQVRDAICDGGDIGEWLWEHLGEETWRKLDGLMEQLATALKEAEPEPAPAAEPEPELPPGEYARVEVMGHDSHTGFVTDGTRAGVPVLRVAGLDGRVFVEVPGPAIFAYVPLPTPLKRPEQPKAITSGTDDERDPWADPEGDYDDERNPF